MAMYEDGFKSNSLHRRVLAFVRGYDILVTRATSSSYTRLLLAHLVEARAHGSGSAAAADAAVEPAPERAGVHGRRAEARAGAPRHLLLLLRGRPRRRDAHGRRLVRGRHGGAGDVEEHAGALRLLRHRDLLDRRRPVHLQVVMILHGRSSTRAATILVNRFLSTKIPSVRHNEHFFRGKNCN